MTSEMTPKFSQEELHDCKNWLLPDVSTKKTIPSAEREALDREKNKKPSLNRSSTISSENESIEIIEELVAPMTADELQKISESAEKEGFNSGFQEGLKKGVSEGKEKGAKEGYDEGILKSKKIITAQCEQLQHVIDALLIPLETEQNELQFIILNMVTELAKAVVLRELKQDSSHITNLVDEALNAIPIGADKFSLYLSSQDLTIVEKHLSYLAVGNEKNIFVHVDESLIPGGCRLETKQTVVDYTVEQRLQKIIDGFLHKRFVSIHSDSPNEVKPASPKDEELVLNKLDDSLPEEKEENATLSTQDYKEKQHDIESTNLLNKDSDKKVEE